MPLESRLFVKTSLLYLLATFVMGTVVAILTVSGRPQPPFVASLHAHLGFVGWLVNVVMGIALWFLPLARERFPQTQGRYPPTGPYIVYVLLNGGLLARIAGEAWWSTTASPVGGGLFALSGVLQTLAVIVFAAIAWQRVRAPSHPAPGVR
jgi:hypothetical protein